MAKCRWDKSRLIFASIPVLVTKGTLEEYYGAMNDRNKTAIYLRLDLDGETLGEPFSHPLPHIHCGDEDTPRFSLDGGNSSNVIMDFLEFLYRNHVPSKWLKWARKQWLSEGAGELREEQFDNIVKAFRDQKLHPLRANADIVSQIKMSLRRAKDSLFDSHMGGSDREILEYPAAR